MHGWIPAQRLLEAFEDFSRRATTLSLLGEIVDRCHALPADVDAVAAAVSSTLSASGVEEARAGASPYVRAGHEGAAYGASQAGGAREVRGRRSLRSVQEPPDAADIGVRAPCAQKS